jgi:hypothetical protein
MSGEQRETTVYKLDLYLSYTVVIMWRYTHISIPLRSENKQSLCIETDSHVIVMWFFIIQSEDHILSCDALTANEEKEDCHVILRLPIRTDIAM